MGLEKTRNRDSSSPGENRARELQRRQEKGRYTLGIGRNSLSDVSLGLRPAWEKKTAVKRGHLKEDGAIGARMAMAVCQTQDDYILGT